ncbi:two pore calcium channel protein 1-like isoform X1 [Portunus trituberculatus]|uniref:two pore calcium channel protein 1-like isoform X1 n=1 Tax=Portunus trituberculatus TaxID=210409 RepID=UPI001E1CC5EA|nr:two pore calcium channel protein 1-like isoform X1 [Portunus trituberculatus]XP_045118037.1 two pore calcium channel protein 1-like isoform X1 [Portunus trituberculatus]XP_045118038.1 two pore calcium channel protein 1-like isoform X1 [Portunus trituberculatus]
METVMENSDTLEEVISCNDSCPNTQDTAAPITKPSNVQHRRNSSLQLRKGSLNQDSAPISVVYRPREGSIQLNNVSDGATSIDSSDPPISDLNLLLAATYVEDSLDGRHSDFKVSERHLKLYRLYQNKWGQVMLYVFLVMHLCLALFESPAVPGLEMSYWVTMLMETGILIFYMFRVTHISIFTPLTRFWSDTKNILILVLIGITFLDMVIYIGLTESGIYSVRWSRALRPLFAVNFPELRQIRRAFRNLRRTLPDVVNVLFLFFFSLAIFALMAYKLFGGRDLKWVDGRPYFDSYWDSIFDLYVLVTTANNPDVMMPAFDISTYYVIFFVVFLVICFFIYMNIILAVIYNNYRKHLKNEVRKSVYSKRQQLSKAFEILASNLRNKRVVTRTRFVQLMKFLDDKKNPTLINVLWIVLDSDGSDYLEKGEFLKLADLLNVEVSEVVDRTTLIGHYLPTLYNSKPSKMICAIVKNRFFGIFFDILTLVNAVVIGIANNDDTWDDAAEWVFLSLFMLEIFLKLYVFGARRFFKKVWNVFDFVVIGAAFIMGVVEAVMADEQESRLSLDVLLVLRVLRLVKIIGSVNRFKVIVHTITKILPSLLTYGAVMLVFYYIFAIVGMEAFQGLVRFSGYTAGSELYCGNEKLQNSDFWRDHYCNNNFNDVIHAFIVLFELTVVNQWHVIAYGYATVTDPWARLYFILFHLTCVIVVLNIFTAFVLEVFILEYTASCQGYLESQMEKKIQEMGLSFRKKRPRAMSTVSNENLVVSDSSESEEETESAPHPPTVEVDGGISPGVSQFYASGIDISSETDVRFHISKRLKNTEILLQKMFEKELSTHDLGPNIESLDQDLQDEHAYLVSQNHTLWSL